MWQLSTHLPSWATKIQHYQRAHVLQQYQSLTRHRPSVLKPNQTEIHALLCTGCTLSSVCVCVCLYLVTMIRVSLALKPNEDIWLHAKKLSCADLCYQSGVAAHEVVASLSHRLFTIIQIWDWIIFLNHYSQELTLMKWLHAKKTKVVVIIKNIRK